MSQTTVHLSQINWRDTHIAVDPLHTDALTMRRQQLLDVFETLDHPGYAKSVGAMIETLDFERGFNTLRYTMNRLQELGEWEHILALFQKRHGELAQGVPATFAECLRRQTLSGMRYQIDDPDHRFFLALLLNVPTRRDIFAFITERVPDQPPITTILQWAGELIMPDDFGIILLDAIFPETLDVPIEAQPSLMIAALEHALDNSKNEDPTTELSVIHETLIQSCLRPLFS